MKNKQFTWTDNNWTMKDLRFQRALATERQIIEDSIDIFIFKMILAVPSIGLFNQTQQPIHTYRSSFVHQLHGNGYMETKSSQRRRSHDNWAKIFEQKIHRTLNNSQFPSKFPRYQAHHRTENIFPSHIWFHFDAEIRDAEWFEQPAYEKRRRDKNEYEKIHCLSRSMS